MKSFFTATLLTTAISGRELFEPGAMDSGRLLSKEKCESKLDRIVLDYCGLKEWNYEICDYCTAEPTKNFEKAAKRLQKADAAYANAYREENYFKARHERHVE